MKKSTTYLFMMLLAMSVNVYAQYEGGVEIYDYEEDNVSIGFLLGDNPQVENGKEPRGEGFRFTFSTILLQDMFGGIYEVFTRMDSMFVLDPGGDFILSELIPEKRLRIESFPLVIGPNLSSTFDLGTSYFITNFDDFLGNNGNINFMPLFSGYGYGIGTEIRGEFGDILSRSAEGVIPRGPGDYATYNLRYLVGPSMMDAASQFTYIVDRLGAGDAAEEDLGALMDFLMFGGMMIGPR